jgi:two-component system NarL family sensor kinase
MAEDDARRRIAEAVHDGPLQKLLAAKQDLLEVSPGRVGVTRASEVVSEGIDDLRRAVGALHPLTIERAGLEGAICAVAVEAESRGGFVCDVDVEGDAGGHHDRILVSLVRELLSNAVKHAHASHVAVRVRRDHAWLRLEVTDDGRGIDAGERLAASSEGHIGLACLEDRVRALGGGMEISAPSDGGTAVSIRLPADARSR